jgi:predicted lipoprotein
MRKLLLALTLILVLTLSACFKKSSYQDLVKFINTYTNKTADYYYNDPDTNDDGFVRGSGTLVAVDKDWEQVLVFIYGEGAMSYVEISYRVAANGTELDIDYIDVNYQDYKNNIFFNVTYQQGVFEFWNNYDGDVYSLARTLQGMTIEDVRAFYYAMTSR